MNHGQHYDQTYAPVASWNSISTLFIMSALHVFYTRQIDYVLAFPQAPVERGIYMQIPKGFKINEVRTSDYIINIHRNIYGQRQAERFWNKYLTSILVNKLGHPSCLINDWGINYGIGQFQGGGRGRIQGIG